MAFVRVLRKCGKVGRKGWRICSGFGRARAMEKSLEAEIGVKTPAEARKRIEPKIEESGARQRFVENEAETVYSGGIVDGQSETYYWNYPPSYEYEDEESDEEDYWNEINDWGRCGRRAGKLESRVQRPKEEV